MPKIKIKDGEFEVSTVVATAILAEQTEKNREIKALKDSIKTKEEELKALNDSVDKTKKELKKQKRKALRDNAISTIQEVDDGFTTKEKNPYKIMADYAEIKDKDKRADKSYVQSYFDSFIAAKIVALNDAVTRKRKGNKNKKIVIPKKYLKGK